VSFVASHGGPAPARGQCKPHHVAHMEFDTRSALAVLLGNRISDRSLSGRGAWVGMKGPLAGSCIELVCRIAQVRWRLRGDGYDVDESDGG